MKKSLIALAVLAASGASFAQVTVTGEYGFGYQKSSAGVRGLQSTDGAVAFNANEDLGGGMKAEAQVKIGGVQGRNSTISSSEDAFVKLTTGAGLFTFGAIESGNSSFNTAGAPLSLPDGLDGRIVDGGTNIDTVSWAAKFGAIGVSLGYYDTSSTGAPGAGDGIVEGYGLGLSYADGPLSLSLAVKNPTSRSLDKAVRVRLGGAFDAGSVKLGLGAQTQTEGMPTQMNVSLSAPLGAVTIGAVYARSEAKTNTALSAAHNARSGFGVGIDYALGKQTKVNLSYGNTDDGSGTGNLDQFRLKMYKSF